VNPSVAEPTIGVLGKPELRAARPASPLTVELLAYLATHRRPAPLGRVLDAVWPDDRPGRRRLSATLDEARAILDALGHPGALPLVHRGLVALDPAVVSDLDALHALVASRRGDEGLRAVEHALSWVRAEPFRSDDRRYEWARLEGLVGMAERLVSDAAHLVADHHLRAVTEPEGPLSAPVVRALRLRAERAARLGLRAWPTRARLWHDVLVAAHDGYRLHAAWGDLLDAVCPEESAS
jgi:hypothetical protein